MFNVVRKFMLYSSELVTVHIIKTMKIILKISLSFLGIGFDHVIVSQAHADIVGIEHKSRLVLVKGLILQL